MKSRAAGSALFREASYKMLFVWIALIVSAAIGLCGLSREIIAGVPTQPEGGLLYFVNTTSDTVVVGACQNGNPGCSLRGAIETANSHAGADGIEIDLPAGSVINLTAVLPDLTESVSISGPSANSITVRRNTGGSYRIFTVTTGPVTFSGLTISDGVGGISNNSTATVTVIDSTLSGNVTASGLGGGIYNNSTGMIVVTNSILSGNSAGAGGGIFNNTTGAVRVTNSTLSDNSATGSSSIRKGGGISKNSGGTLDVMNSTFTGNSAFEGGGISANNTVNLTNCVFVSNGAHNGGGISNRGGTLSVTNCTFTNNGADGSGGGIANNFFGTVNVINSTFSGNIANNGDPNAAGGGAIGNGSIESSNGGFLNITNCTITDNIASRGGGVSTVAAFAGGSMTVTNSTIVRNFSNGSNGGGIYSDSSGFVNIKSTIVALSTGGTGRDVNGFFVSGGFNLIGKVDGGTGFTEATDQTGTVALPLDPKLDPTGLQNNGGPTQTIALQPDSPAIDKGTSNGLTGSLTTDQRGAGFPRKINYPFITNPADPDGDGTDIGAVEYGGPLVPISVSRKVHGAASFDIYLPPTGTAGIECRTGGAANNHQLIMNFPAPVSLTSASVTTGTGSVSNHSVNGSNVTVNLTGVANAQTIVVTLFGVSDGTNTGNVTIPMGVLLSDTTGNGSVNSTDVSLTKSKSGQAINNTNFRTDVTVSNSINSSDVSLVKSKSGTALP